MLINTVKLVSRLSKYAIILMLLALVVFLGARIYISLHGPALSIWHTYVPNEVAAADIKNMTWKDYTEAEEKIFQEVRAEVIEQIESHEKQPFNRYYQYSSTYPGSFKHDWNRSYQKQPLGEAKGSLVLLHGLTDTPYSLRHFAAHYVEQGFAIVAIRLPAHGTVPAALTDVQWQDWVAATELAVKEAQRLAPNKPLHLIGFSNGGALAVKYVLDTLDNPTLPKVDKVILISPMIGITEFARFAGVAGWPAVFPPFVKTAWLGVVPEFNPFKYNSFPVNGAKQSYALTQTIQSQIHALQAKNALTNLPPILTFQSVMDATVSTRAIITSLYNLLPDNGSEIILFDLNRSDLFKLLLRSSASNAINTLLPPAPRRYHTSVITNQSSNDPTAVVLSTAANQTTEVKTILSVAYPEDVFSLSHVAVPFPIDDSLYGKSPRVPNEFGISLGVFSAVGETGSLIVSANLMQRITFNPFFEQMKQKMDTWILPDQE